MVTFVFSSYPLANNKRHNKNKTKQNMVFYFLRCTIETSNDVVGIGKLETKPKQNKPKPSLTFNVVKTLTVAISVQ